MSKPKQHRRTVWGSADAVAALATVSTVPAFLHSQETWIGKETLR